MSTHSPNTDGTLLQDPLDFSLVLGGPLFQLWRRTHLSGDTLEWGRRRVILLTLLTWAPLLALSAAEGHAWRGTVKVPFLYDVGLHVRLLFSLPLLIATELVVHQRMRRMVTQFLERGLVPDAVRAQFDAALASAMRVRNSVTAEAVLLALVFVVGVGVNWRTKMTLGVESWYGVSASGGLKPSLAGWWLGCVSVPLFQFLLLRWYLRFFIWARFLWQVSRVELNIIPTHPDRCGGLGFLAVVSSAFSPLLLAQGALMAGMIADRIFYTGAKLPEFEVDLIGLTALLVLAIIGPLLVFTPKLAAAKRAGLREYGTLAERYVREFDHKWLRGGAPAGEPLLGSADLQSLADLGNSFAVVSDMRYAPFTLQTVVHLAVATLLPAAPLVLTMFSMEELLERLLQTLF
jgi:hypothetical protein